LSLAEIIRLSLRYTFAFGKGYLSTFLSSLSMAGLVLAIALLIIVLSVMNGFDKEMRERILGLVPHVTVYSHAPMHNWQEQAALVSKHDQVVSVSPFSQFDALFMRGGDIETARGIGIDIGHETLSGQLLNSLGAHETDSFQADKRGLILGAGLADKLNVSVGDVLTLVVPSRVRGGAPQATRFERVNLRGILNTGTEMDQSAALVHLELASALAGLDGGVTGLRISTRDIFAVARIAWELVGSLPPGYYATNWMMTHGNLYAAIQLSRDLVSILLFSIIAVAAFNVVSSLVLVVFDKQGDIAILRTLGATPGNIATIFVVQGAMIGLVGVTLGTALGVVGSLAVPDLVSGLEKVLSINFLNTDVYPVSFLPVDILGRDLALVAAIAFIMCVLAAIYPALRAAALQPATVLHQE
jgi:lipoprotein-releasing system permease protein